MGGCLGSISLLKHIRLNFIDIICLHIFRSFQMAVWILRYPAGIGE